MKPVPIVDNFIAPPCYGEVRILHQDTDILLIDKPSGLLSLSGKNPLNIDSVHYRLVNGWLKGKGVAQTIQAFPTARLIHRLDFGTSGIMVVALTDEATRNVSKQFEQRQVTKQYIAVLEGHVNLNHGFIEYPVAKDRVNFPLQKICTESGKAATSEYYVLERSNNPVKTKVKFIPKSGRTHQLRIHSLAIGHPILGCDLYKSQTSEAQAERLLLHAAELTFSHPASGERVQGLCPCPF